MKRLLWCIPLIALLLPLQVNAQSLMTAPSREDGIAIEGFKPNFDQAFDDNIGASFPSSAWFLSGRYTVHPSFRLGAEIGLSHYGVDRDIVGVSENETAFGNVLLTAEWLTPVENLTTSIGVRIPTASDSDNMGLLTGNVVDIERVAAFAPDVWTIMAEGDYNYPINQNFSLRVNAAPLLVIDRSEEDETTSDFGARYAAQGWYNGARFMASAGLIGTTNFTMDSTEGFDRTDLAVGGSLIGKVGRYQPGVNFQVPVTSNYSDLVSWVVGVSLRIPM